MSGKYQKRVDRIPRRSTVGNINVPKTVQDVKDLVVSVAAFCGGMKVSDFGLYRPTVDTEFDRLNAGLEAIEAKIGTELFTELIDLSNRARFAYVSHDKVRGATILGEMFSQRWTGRRKSTSKTRPKIEAEVNPND